MPAVSPSGVDEGNILTVNSVPRCKLLSDVLEKTGLVERSGQGVDKMFFNCLMEGKALPTYAGTDNYQVCLNFTAAIEEPELMKFFQREQAKRPKDQQLNVFDLLTLFKIHKNDFQNLNSNSLKRLQNEGLIEVSEDRYTILGTYVNPYAHILKSIDINILRKVNDLFAHNTRINRTIVNHEFSGSLTDRQVRVLIAKMEELGLTVREGEKRGVQYRQTDLYRKML